ncbi:hypothetical protein FUAX_17030 [Fulvitalea axinellae]|uniref:Tetracyclin repressor-like C-terminal domain-containing protein n=1 Tax=Fulvitalea axinellae TaxID=1182444 RepID=A0AAU9CK13_9BACT|nr:hypothetical protein FUAX_17030 [Fulvitalea axinellae]
MAKKKNVTADQILSWFMDYTLEKGENPKSVYAFAKEHNFEESLFYQHFASFQVIEEAVFKAFFDNADSLLKQDESFSTYSPQEKLLSFYFTFFEILTANRSYVVYALGKNRNKLKTLATLRPLRDSFRTFIKELGIESGDMKHEKIEKIKNRSIEEMAWAQLLLTLKFWIEDRSPSFEKTDLFIEKSVKASFELLNTRPLESVVDFGKFLFKERIKPNL